MSNVARQILFISAVAIFVCVLTVVLFYGSGYQINWRSGDITTTSGITVVTLPKTATIALQPDDSTKTTPAHFTQLEPGHYTVTVSADGYFSQTLQINLQSQAAIQFEPVQLWPVDAVPRLTDVVQASAPVLPTTMLNNESATIHQNTRTGQWLLQQSNSLFIYDPATEATRTLVRLAEPITAATWHGNGWYVVYSTATQLHIIDTRIDYTNSDTIIAEVTNVTSLQCADNGWSCSYSSGNTTYTVSLR